MGEHDTSRENLLAEPIKANYQSLVGQISSSAAQDQPNPISMDPCASQPAQSASANEAFDEPLVVTTYSVTPDFDKDIEDANADETRRSRVRLCFKIVLIVLAVLAVLTLLTLYGVVPACFYWSSWVRRTVFFQAFTGGHVPLSDPQSFGLNCSKSYYVTSDHGVQLGSWYVQSGGLPCSVSGEMFPGTSQTVLYLHGIAHDRAAKNRVKLMQVLSSEVKLHVVSFDYRGFGDSTNELPSLQSVVNDSLAMYKSIRTTVARENIIIWGHSMGTSAAVYLAAELHRMGESPSAIVLEAALDDVVNVARVSSKLKIWRVMPCFKAVFLDPLISDPTTAFNSTATAKHLDPAVPVLMLHAEDDPTIPFADGLRLRDAITDARKTSSNSATVSFIPFNTSYHFGHNYIPFYPGLPELVERFLNGTRATDGADSLDTRID